MGECAGHLPTDPDCYWAQEQGLIAGEYPGAPVEAAARARLARLLAAGVRVFVDLTEAGEWGTNGLPLEPYDALLRDEAARLGVTVRHVRFAVRDLGIPTATLMREILTTILNALDARERVYLHCLGGIGRTGTVIGCWLVEQGMTGDEALGTIRQLRAGIRKRHAPSPETAEQRRFVQGWRAAAQSRGRS